MNYLVVIDNAVQKLNEHGYTAEAEQIILLKRGGSTAGEIMTTIIHAMLSFVRTDLPLATLLDEEIRELKLICDYNGFKRY